MKLKIKSWMAVAMWKWIANDTDCGICRLPFDGCCPDCRVPGDDCPLGKSLPFCCQGLGMNVNMYLM